MIRKFRAFWGAPFPVARVIEFALISIFAAYSFISLIDLVFFHWPVSL